MLIERNPNKAKADKIAEAVRKNDGYCPCSLLKDDDHICMCKEFLERETVGWCHCGLYYKKEL